MKAWTIVILTVTFFTETAAQNPQWGKLKAGRHKVGYQLLLQYDDRRNVKLKSADGKTTIGPLPVQINIWYPALAGDQAVNMLYEEYVYLDWRKNSFEKLGDAVKSEAMERARAIGGLSVNQELTKERSDALLTGILKTKTAAIKDASHAAGKFPVIISGCHNGPMHENVLYEYLASLGYVVIQVPTPELDISRPRLLIDRVNMIEYITAFAKTLPYVDIEKLGIMGFNFDGTAAIAYQMRNGRADAVASIEGWEGHVNNDYVLMKSPFYDVRNFAVPFYGFYSDDKEIPLSQTVFDSLVYSPRYMEAIKNFDHMMLVSTTLFARSTPDKAVFCQYLYERIGNFFDAYVKNASTGLTAADRGLYPEDMMKVELKKQAVPLPKE